MKTSGLFDASRKIWSFYPCDVWVECFIYGHFEKYQVPIYVENGLLWRAQLGRLVSQLSGIEFDLQSRRRREGEDLVLETV